MDANNMLSEISKSLKEVYIENGKDKYIVNRYISSAFVDIFREALFERGTGFALVERFIDEEYVTKKEVGYVTDEKVIDESRVELERMKDNPSVTQEDINIVVQNIEGSLKQEEMYFYKVNSIYGDCPVIEVNKLSEKNIEDICDTHAYFISAYFMFMGSVNPIDYSVNTTVYKGKGYSDILVFIYPIGGIEGE